MMRTNINNLKQAQTSILYRRIEYKELFDRILTGTLRFGKVFILIFDLICLTFCLCLSGCIIKDATWTFSEDYVSGMIFFNLLWVFLCYLRGIHKDFLLADGMDLFRTLAKVFFVFITCSLFIFLILLDSFNNLKLFFLFITLFIFLFGSTLVANRVMLLVIRKRYKSKIRKKKNVFIIGDSSSCELLESYIEENQCDLRLCGYYNHDENSPFGSNGTIRGRIEECINYFKEMKVDEIYCSLQSVEEDSARELIREADRNLIRIKFLPDYYQLFRRPSTIELLGTIPIISIRDEPLTIDKNVIIKRLFDFFFSLLVIIFILSWLIPIVGLLIKIESRGPVFFKQPRSGLNNQAFNVYKFRSMRTVTGYSEEIQAMKDDIRLTKIGAFLRRTSIDELPQFINVLLGNMSIVGPRPHMLLHTTKFSEEVDTYMVRHFAKPGITGWAQVSGFRGETKTVEAIEGRVQHDVWYIENWSLMLDMKIVFLTVWNVIKGEENAY